MIFNIVHRNMYERSIYHLNNYNITNTFERSITNNSMNRISNIPKYR